MPETRFTDFPALSVYPQVRISRSASNLTHECRSSNKGTGKIVHAQMRCLNIRFTEFPALSVDLRVWISRSALDTDV